MERFLTSEIPVYAMAAITVLGILGTWATGIYYRQMINQTSNMMSVRHLFLLQMKNKFENTYRVNKGIEDVPLFVDRQLKENRFLGMNAEKMGKASQKAALVCLILGGIWSLLRQTNGFEVQEVVTSLSITVFCFMTGYSIYLLSDMAQEQERLKIQLEEYFTNTLSKRVLRTREDEKALDRADNKNKKKKRMVHVSSDDYSADSQEESSNISNIESTQKQNVDSEEEHFTEEDLQYLRQSLERIAAGRERNTGNQKKHQFSPKEGKVIDDILKEYFV